MSNEKLEEAGDRMEEKLASGEDQPGVPWAKLWLETHVGTSSPAAERALDLLTERRSEADQTVVSEYGRPADAPDPLVGALLIAVRRLLAKRDGTEQPRAPQSAWAEVIDAVNAYQRRLNATPRTADAQNEDESVACTCLDARFWDDPCPRHGPTPNRIRERAEPQGASLGRSEGVAADAPVSKGPPVMKPEVPPDLVQPRSGATLATPNASLAHTCRVSDRIVNDCPAPGCGNGRTDPTPSAALKPGEWTEAEKVLRGICYYAEQWEDGDDASPFHALGHVRKLLADHDAAIGTALSSGKALGPDVRHDAVERAAAALDAVAALSTLPEAKAAYVYAAEVVRATSPK